MVKIRCRECDKFIGYKDGPDFEVDSGLCIDCAEKEDKEMIRKYNLKVVDMIEDLMIQAIKTKDPRKEP